MLKKKKQDLKRLKVSLKRCYFTLSGNKMTEKDSVLDNLHAVEHDFKRSIPVEHCVAEIYALDIASLRPGSQNVSERLHAALHAVDQLKRLA